MTGAPHLQLMDWTDMRAPLFEGTAHGRLGTALA